MGSERRELNFGVISSKGDSEGGENMWDDRGKGMGENKSGLEMDGGLGQFEGALLRAA